MLAPRPNLLLSHSGLEPAMAFQVAFELVNRFEDHMATGITVRCRVRPSLVVNMTCCVGLFGAILWGSSLYVDSSLPFWDILWGSSLCVDSSLVDIFCTGQCLKNNVPSLLRHVLPIGGDASIAWFQVWLSRATPE